MQISPSTIGWDLDSESYSILEYEVIKNKLGTAGMDSMVCNTY